MKRSGFTLLELLIALVIFAILGTISYGGLQTIIKAKAVSDQQAERLRALQLAITFLTRDLEQLAPRSIRNAYDSLSPPLWVPVSGEPLLEMTRAGLANPAELPRSHLQRVAYHLDDEGQLARWVWPVLDRASDQEPFKEIMLTKVRSLTFQLLDSQGAWQTSWTGVSQTSNEEEDIFQDRPPVSDLPVAVAIHLDVVDFGKIRRVIILK